MALIPFSSFEQSLVKLVGGSVTTFLAMLVLQRIIIPYIRRVSPLTGFRHAASRAASRPGVRTL